MFSSSLPAEPNRFGQELAHLTQLSTKTKSSSSAVMSCTSTIHRARPRTAPRRPGPCTEYNISPRSGVLLVPQEDQDTTTPQPGVDWTTAHSFAHGRRYTGAVARCAPLPRAVPRMRSLENRICDKRRQYATRGARLLTSGRHSKGSYMRDVQTSATCTPVSVA